MSLRRSTFDAIGTKWDILVQDEVSEEAWSTLMQKIYLRIQAFDKTYSRFRTDSLVAHAAHNAGRHDLPPDGFEMIRFYEQLYETTDGQVTPLIGQTMNDAGYDAAYSFQKKSLHRPPAWKDVIDYDKTSMTLKQPAWLDFGAAGKGLLVDIISRLITEAGLSSYTINAGGDILHRSAKKEYVEVGLENPFETNEAIGIAKLGNRSLCASSGSKRKWEGMHHIINPSTLESPTEIAATWVIAASTMLADGIATALFFTPPETLLKHFSFSYVIVRGDTSLKHSRDFPLQLFEAEAT
jgi:thiamine biosynthesis lipoprotein